MALLRPLFLLLCSLCMASIANSDCPDYDAYAMQRNPPYTGGTYNLPSQRPDPSCRTFRSSVVENAINKTAGKISDPDLKQLFINTFPNTLDTCIGWKGYANGSDNEELTFVITGDITAMWLRDSANQLQSYVSLLEPSQDADSLASLYRGVINLQSRYILLDPYCNAFQPPVESGIKPSVNTAAVDDEVTPNYSNKTVFECKYELDSLAAFLEISRNYYNATGDIDFFKKYNWIATIEKIMDTAEGEMIPTYQADGKVNDLPYTFVRGDDVGTQYPVNRGTGLISSWFRPSDDWTIFRFLIPSNMMFASLLEPCSEIASNIGQAKLAKRMIVLSSILRTAIQDYAIVSTTEYGDIYAYETDGFLSRNMMDDANIPSLLAAPIYGFLDADDPVYEATRKFILSADNPYYMYGPVISAVGGPHDGPGYAWPMASIVRILTSNDDSEITQQLQELVSSTDGLGLMHESINTFNQSDWTREW